MFPLRDHNPSGRVPYVTYALIVLNVAVFLLALPLQASVEGINSYYGEWAMIPARISQFDGLWTLLTSMFMHGGFLHIAFNMLFLWIFGDNLEDEMGHLPYLGFYLLSGLGAAMVQYLSAPYSMVPMVGASGAIAGVMGGYLLLFPRARVDVLFILIIFFKIVPIPAWVMLGLWFGLQVIGGLGADPDAGGVAHWAHAGGFVTGVLLALPLFRRLGGPAFWDRTHGRPPHPVAEYQISHTRVPTVRRRR
ncbi:rhomboid family intramembrane serine protease [Pseudooceanicola sp. LIPI14-2-Ac024]|uniref:rhomboid family intramembrane serine protease n=1 Tax=Pseudooceanicola sp. LIPI14-2-Ac024 TaxID=3344875 RepID=UPI0035CEB35D